MRRSGRRSDRRLAAGDVDVEGALDALFEHGLVRSANAFFPTPSGAQSWMLEPARDRLVPGPRVLLDHGGKLYGGPRIYMPVRPLLLWDAGAFSGPVPADEPAEKRDA